MRMSGAALPAMLLMVLAGGAAAQPRTSVAITNVTVIDAVGGARAGQTVLVRGNKVSVVGPVDQVRVPPRARRIDGRGKFLIPGLWDMHVHTDVIGGRALLALYVANGVTGVRDMAGNWDTLKVWRSQIAVGGLVGPRIVASGPYLEGGDSPVAHLLARDPAEGAAAVDSLASLGVDFVKVHGQLKRDVYFAIARRARERGMVFAGHVPQAVGARAASDSGQRSIEHLLTIPMPCTPAESLALRPRFPMQAALGRCSSQSPAPLYQALVSNGTWVTPTFAAMVELAGWPRREVPGDSLAHHVPDTLRRFVAGIFPMPDSIPPNADSVGQAVLERRLGQVRDMSRAGVGLLAGTDAPMRNSPPGFGLHEELSLLARGGLTPIEILRAATWEPARYLGMLDSAGTIQPGRLADLVLLDADPLLDIRNARRIALVIANGRLLEPEEGRRLMRKAATQFTRTGTSSRSPSR